MNITARTAIIIGLAMIMIGVLTPSANALEGLIKTCDKPYMSFQPPEQRRMLAQEHAENLGCCYPQLPPTPGEGGCGTEKFFQFARRFMVFLTLNIAIPVSFFLIAFGGIVILFSRGSPERYNTGKKIITLTVIGLAITLSAYMIVNLIFLVLTGVYYSDITTFRQRP